MVTYGAVGASTAGLPKQQPIAELWQQSITQLQQQWQQPITEVQQQSITELRDGRGPPVRQRLQRAVELKFQGPKRAWPAGTAPPPSAQRPPQRLMPWWLLLGQPLRAVSPYDAPTPKNLPL